MQKSWGRNQEIFRDDLLEIVRIEVLSGGFSSRHLHRGKHNAFLVVSGQLSVVCFETELPAEHILSADAPAIVVPAGVEHRFLARTGPVIAYEIYVAAGEQSLDALDIVRRDEGGILSAGCGTAALAQ